MIGVIDTAGDVGVTLTLEELLIPMDAREDAPTGEGFWEAGEDCPVRLFKLP